MSLSKFLNKHDSNAFPAMWEMAHEYRTILIFGLRGSGKSSLLKSIAKSAHYDSEMMENFIDEIREMRKFDEWENLQIPRTRVFENGCTILNFPDEKTIHNYFIDTEQYGLPDGKNDVALLPFYCMCLFDEVQNAWNGARKGSVEEYQEQGIMKDRHADRTSVMTTHRIGVLSASLKQLVDGFFWINHGVKTYWFPILKRDKDGKLRFKKQNFLSVWKGVFYSDLEDAERKKKPYGILVKPIIPIFQRLFSLGGGQLREVVEWKKFRFWGDIFAYYNSKRYRPSFIRDLSGKEFTLIDPIDDKQKFTPDYVKNFNVQDRVFRKKSVEEQEKLNKKNKKIKKVEE